MTLNEDINPEILRWARDTAGISVEQAAGKLALKDTAKASAIEKLAAMESGARGVTARFLHRAANLYRRPVSVFYLDSPPPRAERGEDFRKVVGAPLTRENALLDALLRDVRARQAMLREVLIEEGEGEVLPFVASANVRQGALAVAELIRAEIGIEVGVQVNAKSPEGVFAMLRAAIERSGVFVLLLGDLGSHQSDIGEEVFRGIALADDLAPFIVINDNDAVVARSFTLLHELAHVWIGTSGVSGPVEGIPQNRIERFCNAVAGQFLLPLAAITGWTATGDDPYQDALAWTARVADVWNVSQAAVAYRILEEKLITQDVASEIFATLTRRRKAARASEKAARDPDEQGPGYYVLRRSRLGTGLLDVVRRAVQDDILTHTKAAKILGVRSTSVQRLLFERTRNA